MLQGNVFNIQRYTIHDGPGIRTEIFLKGCPLSCKWCGNPEGRCSEPQLGFYPSRCIGKEKCGLCNKVCRREGELCTGCMMCAENCPADAIKAWGKTISVEDAMEIIRRDRSYYESSGGGVTISGGEPMVQPAFTKAILKRCSQEGIHTCLESTLCTDWNIAKEVIPYVDMIITDIKHMDAAIHEKYTGVSNERILENLSRLPEMGKPIIVRIPVIPGVNDDMENIENTADFIISKMKNNIRQLQLLGFMRLGEEKYKSLGMEYPMRDLKFDRVSFQDHVKEIAAYFNKRGIRCKIGTKERD